ncbi:MAG: NlpC/P60 family protein [Acidobacteria bacterium]|nr:NlpC/P60 family protein [Acidobacteriota bacterium]
MLRHALRGIAPGILLILVGLISASAAACASSGAVPRPFPSPDWNAPASTPEAPRAPATPSPTPPGRPGALPAPPSLRSHRYDGRAVAEFALGFRGVPYRDGGVDPAGFDCSGLVQYVFAQYGVGVPRVVEQQYRVGDKIRPSNIKPGDLLFFSTKGPGASHVAIAIGEGRFVHAPNSTGVVRVEALASAYWGSRYIGARRVTPSTTTN